jgi:exosome complex component CSL4
VFTYDNLGEHTVVLSLDVHRRLVRFLHACMYFIVMTRFQGTDNHKRGGAYDFEQDVACGKRFALFLFPSRDPALCHCRTHRRHRKFGERMTARGRVQTWNITRRKQTLSILHKVYSHRRTPRARTRASDMAIIGRQRMVGTLHLPQLSLANICLAQPPRDICPSPMDDILLPGQPIQAQVVASGMYARDGVIRSSLLGVKCENGVRPVVAGRPQPPSPGAIVIGTVTRLSPLQATLSITVVDGVPLPHGEEFTGVIRVQDVRSTEKDKVKIADCFRGGDVVRGAVVGLAISNK